MLTAAPAADPLATSRTLRVGFDLDNVLYPLKHVYPAFACEIGELDPAQASEIVDWKFWLNWGWTDDDFWRVLYAGVEAGRIFTDGDPDPDAQHVMRTLQDQGHQVVIVTAREIPHMPGVAEAATQAWLARHGLPYDELHVVTSKLGIELDTMIEDSPDQHDILTEAGVHVVLRDQPWNRDHPTRTRVHELIEYLDVVAQVA